MHLTWDDVQARADEVAARWQGAPLTGVYGVPQGGAVPAVMVARTLGLPILDSPDDGCLVVDDLVDSGATAERFQGHFDALYRKPHSPHEKAPAARELDGWAVFPWEADPVPTDAVRRLLQHLGENPDREGLADTPKRVVKALSEMTRGYQQDPAAILSTTFNVAHDQMIHVKGISVVSMCEHHMLPFTGTAHVAYIPSDRVVGLSKIPRVVHTFARRLQVQERLTDQIADAINDTLHPQGVGVRITAHHACMGLRGVGEREATMTTTALRGCFFKAEARAEFLAQ